MKKQKTGWIDDMIRKALRKVNRQILLVQLIEQAVRESIKQPNTWTRTIYIHDGVPHLGTPSMGDITLMVIKGWQPATDWNNMSSEEKEEEIQCRIDQLATKARMTLNAMHEQWMKLDAEYMKKMTDGK
jgi:hypothetical protein